MNSMSQFGPPPPPPPPPEQPPISPVTLLDEPDWVAEYASEMVDYCSNNAQHPVMVLLEILPRLRARFDWIVASRQASIDCDRHLAQFNSTWVRGEVTSWTNYWRRELFFLHVELEKAWVLLVYLAGIQPPPFVQMPSGSHQWHRDLQNTLVAHPASPFAALSIFNLWAQLTQLRQMRNGLKPRHWPVAVAWVEEINVAGVAAMQLNGAWQEILGATISLIGRWCWYTWAEPSVWGPVTCVVLALVKQFRPLYMRRVSESSAEMNEDESEGDEGGSGDGDGG